MDLAVVLNMYIQACISVFMASWYLYYYMVAQNMLRMCVVKKNSLTNIDFEKINVPFVLPTYATCSVLPSDISILAWLAAK